MKKISLILIGLYSSLYASEISAMHDACERDIATACDELGSIYYGDYGLIPNLKKAEFYYKMACHLEYQESCERLDMVHTKQLLGMKK